MNTVSDASSRRLWPSEHQPRAVTEVGNTDDWLAAIAADRGFGMTTTATSHIYPYPGVGYYPLTDAPQVPVRLAWPDPPANPAIPDLAACIRETAQTSIDGRRCY
ncbi:hypothetical protein RCO28_27165 [Streptomyces sp. LHD-70]|uniref:hypothetical protein n=1 Tax=Streptomyces sp. LHD-70 TaxID=3072140 RepID=UPI00280CE108|nr:hypothetical protein [Streptomyces sp. LHD-70]MDQ8706123.1 hypothetical protein [Streptomyces sp. LHD-70]